MQNISRSFNVNLANFYFFWGGGGWGKCTFTMYMPYDSIIEIAKIKDWLWHYGESASNGHSEEVSQRSEMKFLNTVSKTYIILVHIFVTLFPLIFNKSDEPIYRYHMVIFLPSSICKVIWAQASTSGIKLNKWFSDPKSWILQWNFISFSILSTPACRCESCPPLYLNFGFISAIWTILNNFISLTD